jgi:hypothetical protein
MTTTTDQVLANEHNPDPLDRQPSVQQELACSDGSLPRPFDIRRSTREQKQHLLGFMFEKVMPLSEALEGYDLFDKMKVQKVVFELEH